MYECTAPSDRLLVTGFEPQVFFYAERAFAGGQVYLHPGWHASAADQRLTAERLERQRVPIVLSIANNEGVLPLRLPMVYDYVHRRYTLVAESAFGGSRVYQVLVNSQLRPTGPYEPLNLPCYR